MGSDPEMKANGWPQRLAPDPPEPRWLQVPNS